MYTNYFIVAVPIIFLYFVIEFCIKIIFFYVNIVGKITNCEEDEDKSTTVWK